MAPGPVMEFMGRVAFEATQMRPLLPTYLHLLLSAIFPIYTAAYASLARPASAAKPEKKEKAKGDVSDDEDDVHVVQKIESLTAIDALTFPLLAGVSLTSLYFLIKWLEDPTILNKILAVYFSQMGLFFGAKFLKDMFSTARSMWLPNQYSLNRAVWHVDASRSCFTATSPAGATSNSSPLPGRLRKIPLPRKVSAAIWQLRKLVYTKARLRLNIYKIIKLYSPIDVLDIISLLVVAGIVVWQTCISTPWYLTNFMGFSFCYGSLQMVTPTTGWVGTLILSALFIYDIYFVFFTPMMVTVATKLEVPIKLLFPRPDGCVMPIGAPEGSEAILEYLECLAKKRRMAMLGLGDIVVPGMILAFALRFDLYRFYLKQGTSAEPGNTNFVAAKKPKYLPATGRWGERFWTNSELQSAELQAKSFPKPYFHATVVGYLAGMVVTMLVMQVFQHAQPALLYLVPGVLLSLWGTALVRGELKLLWAYTEDQEDEEKEKANEATKEKKDDKENLKTEDSTAAASEKKTEQEPKKVVENAPISLISFSITLPAARKSSSTDKIDTTVNASTPSLNYQLTTSKPSNSADSEESYDVLPDVKADHEIFDKLSREISQSKEEAETPVTTGADGKPASKRRRKA